MRDGPLKQAEAKRGLGAGERVALPREAETPRRREPAQRSDALRGPRYVQRAEMCAVGWILQCATVLCASRRRVSSTYERSHLASSVRVGARRS